MYEFFCSEHSIHKQYLIHTIVLLLIVDFSQTLSDETCVVSLDHVYYECGSDVNESVCESMGCCYNSSADTTCYYPSG